MLGPVSVDRVVREAVKKYATFFIKRHITLDFRETTAQTMSDEKWLTFVGCFLFLGLFLGVVFTFAVCTAVTLLGFGVIYALVYMVTAREYYKIVG